jgi:hypothetical protein
MERLSETAEHRARSTSKVQAIYFPRSVWTLGDARAWIKAHGFQPLKVHQTPTQYRFRLLEPKYFRNFSTIVEYHLGKPIDFVIGYRYIGP